MRNDSNNKQISVLFLAADPTDATRLRLGEEFREIDEQLRGAKYRDLFKLENPNLATRPRDISDALVRLMPRIVHFSGHGSEDGALCFEDLTGCVQNVQFEALAALFSQFSNVVHCVILNACFSETQARAIANHIDYVIGMNSAISDQAAITFSRSFYQALGANFSVEKAYELGRVGIQMENIPEHLTPVLIRKARVFAEDGFGLIESSIQLDPRYSESFKPYGKQRRDLLRYFTDDWLPRGTRVAILQGFPGCGKSQLAIDVAAKATRSLDLIEAQTGAHRSPMDVLIDLAQALANEGIPDLLNEVEKGADGDLVSALTNVLRREPILIVIDEFQRFFAPNESHPPPTWQQLVEQLNNSNQPLGRLLLICNRATKIARWCEKCVIKELRGLDPTDATALLADLLEQKELTAKLPAARLPEICQRLGGNPRALATLVGGLLYDSLDELLSLVPALFEVGDVTINPNLVEDFEREVLERTLSQIEPDLLLFMRQIAVHRRPFKKEAMSELSCGAMPPEALRRELIERFLVVDTASGNTIHPLAREICVTRLRGAKADWLQAHGWAANYHLRHFKAISMKGADRCLTSYSELRHHLFEAGRVSELFSASTRFARFVLSQIPTVNQSQVPVHSEVLAERIALISALPDDQRTKGLEFHLALCLKHRNIGDDYQTALAHVYQAVGPNAYYAAWLLLIELEYALNGRAAMLSAQNRALRHLGSGSNAFAVYFLCANLLGKNREFDGAIDILEKGISTPGVQCLASLTDLCATFMERADRRNDAIDVLRKCIATPNTPELYKVQIRCALLLEKVGRLHEGALLLRKGIADPHATYLDKLYLALTELFLNAGKWDAALQLLKEGLEDTRVKDKGAIYCRTADLLMQAKCDSEATDLLRTGLSSRFVKDPVPLHHKLTAIVARADGANAASAVLATFKSAVLRSDMAGEPSIYLTCAKQLFHLRDVEDAINILKQGLKAVDQKEKAPIYQMCAELTARQGRLDEAVLLLESGFVDKCVRDGAYLYQVCAELLDKGGRADDAITLLQRSINIPALKNKVVLFQACAKLLGKASRAPEGVALLERAITLPGMTGHANLYRTCARLMMDLGRRQDAIELLRTAIDEQAVGNLASLYQLCAEQMILEEQREQAIVLLEKGIASYPTNVELKSFHEKTTAL